MTREDKLRAQGASPDTIAAVSTAPGEGGIGIIRISGRDAVKIASKIFAVRDKKNPRSFKSHTVHYGHVVDALAGRGKGIRKNVIDEALLTIMRAPKTYTREDVAEISCHGGAVAVRKTLELAVKHGARPAEPGEFTKRAFLNGRIDLAQAEAVLDIIQAKTDAGLRASINQLEGGLSKEIKAIRGGVIDVCADIEALIDFPEEGIVPSVVKNCLRGIKAAGEKLEKLLASYHDGAILKEGITAVICGRPNVGKSSLLNLLLRKNRAIVTHIPGTTRDTIEAAASIRGLPINLVDTAGIRKEGDIIEAEGIKRSRLYLSSADLILCVLDAGEKLKKEDRAILEKIKSRSAIVLLNKCDLKPKLSIGAVKKIAKGADVLRISCLYKTGIDKLEDRIYNRVWSGKVFPSGEAMVNNIRHKKAIESARAVLYEAERSISEGALLELAASDLRLGADCLGEITGEAYTGDILDAVFSKFCIGK